MFLDFLLFSISISFETFHDVEQKWRKNDSKQPLEDRKREFKDKIIYILLWILKSIIKFYKHNSLEVNYQVGQSYKLQYYN